LWYFSDNKKFDKYAILGKIQIEKLFYSSGSIYIFTCERELYKYYIKHFVEETEDESIIKYIID
jgi:hypothetical protein